MKKLLWAFLLIILLVAAFASWKIFGPNVKSPEGKFFYIKTGSVYSNVVNDLKEQKIISSSGWFNLVAKQLKYKTIKPGKYEIKKDMSVFNLVRMLRNGNQTPVNLVITKFRIKEDMARKVSGQFEFDSAAMMAFLTNNDSLKNYGLDTNTWTTAVIPDTYTYFWNSTPSKVFSKLHAASEKFWTDERKQKASQHGITPTEAYIVASIIDEETNNKAEKGTIASVYLNRVKQGIPLQADPTVKFAMRDFGLKRIYNKHLTYPSPYNTYYNKGFPPGPICTPSVATIDDVLNSPKTDYIYFVANPDFSGTHIFNSDYDEHLKDARELHIALNRQDSIRKAKQ